MIVHISYNVRGLCRTMNVSEGELKCVTNECVQLGEIKVFKIHVPDITPIFIFAFHMGASPALYGSIDLL